MAWVNKQQTADTGINSGVSGTITRLMVIGQVTINRPFIPVPSFTTLIAIKPKAAQT
jgi:hypothetical protein